MAKKIKMLKKGNIYNKNPKMRTKSKYRHKNLKI